ncbi:bifunctional transcriptional activator/DNA repair enzyme AdaA [Pseudalkalibacillus sp. SCS-8]|uniref:bifunctional transcriptional activator/DNA repair enzyme AdaA n=1 Tax=Pseudalkalibacillus nanhaiensis TaxID=3115291 RepID=UPI0032DA063E
MNEDVFQSVYETMMERDTRFDGIYYVGIRSTGIVCRPSCRSRLPKRENVSLYTSVEEALQAGFRPCKRCKPENPGHLGPDAEMVAAVQNIINRQYREPLTLKDIAQHLNVSPYHLHRVVKRSTGETPSALLVRKRLEKAVELFYDSQQTIAKISGKVGFKSPSHFSAVFKKMKGCSPNEYRQKVVRRLGV